MVIDERGEELLVPLVAAMEMYGINPTYTLHLLTIHQTAGRNSASKSKTEM